VTMYINVCCIEKLIVTLQEYCTAAIHLEKLLCVCATDDNERKPYFEPREAKPDHPVMKRGAAAAVAVNQVVPPDVQNGFDSPPVSADVIISCVHAYCCSC